MNPETLAQTCRAKYATRPSQEQLLNQERERIYLEILEHPSVLVVMPSQLHEIVFGDS